MAWSIVGISTVVETTTTTLTLTEPAGVASGDLLIACISNRQGATTSTTLPSGWTLVNSIYRNSTATNNTATPSGTMAYIVRGGSAPALGFTLGAANVALGRIVAYRGNAATTPLDVSTAAVTSTNVTAISVTGLTTTQGDDLIVGMCCGGQEGTWSAFKSANAPTTQSAATDTTTAPSTTIWIERGDSLTVTGADCSLAIFDAVKTVAGATGNFTANTTVAAANVVIAGAFKLPPPTLVTVTAPPAMVVSVGSLAPPSFVSIAVTSYGTRDSTILNMPAGAQPGDYLIGALYSGQTGSVPTTFPPNGWSGSATNTDNGTYYSRINRFYKRVVGDEPASVTCSHNSVSFASEGFIALYRNVGGTGDADGFTAASTNHAGAGNPLSSTLTAGNVAHSANSMLVASAINSDGTGTLDPPTGMTERYDGWAYLSDQQLPNAGSTGNRTQTLASVNPWICTTLALASPGDGKVADAALTTLNPADKKDANVALSNGNLTATGNGSANNWVRSTNARTGKRYVEFTVTTVANQVIGIADKSSLTYPGDDAGSFGLYSNGFGGINGTFPDWSTPYASGNVVGMAVDLDAKLVWWRVGSGNWNGNAANNPATGVGGLSVSAYTGTPHYVIVSGDAGSVTTVNFNATAPSGFYAWDGIIPVSVTVNLTAPNALTVSVGDQTVAGKATSNVTGFGLTASVGTVDFKTDQKLTETGFGLTADVGTVTVEADALVNVTGQEAALSVGDVSVTIVAPPVGEGMAKVWTGSAWARKPAKVWTGSAWVAKPVKFWTGSAWVPTAGEAAPEIERTGSVLQYSIYNTAGTGTVATNITVPADAELVMVAVSGYHGSAGGGFTGGYTLFTKGGVDTPMVPATGGDSENFWQCAMFTLALPDTGTNKTLKWSWYFGGSAADGHINFSITFWKGIDTASPVRSSGGDQANTGAGWPVVNTPTLTAQAGDKIVAFAGFFRSGANTDGLGEIDTWSNLTEITEIPNEGYAEGAWASGDPTGNTSVGILTASNTSEGGIVAVVLKPAGGAATGPSSSLLTSFSPGGIRSDFGGEVGVRLNIIANKEFTWLGAMAAVNGLGLQRVAVYNFFTLALIAEGTVDFTGKAPGEWAWVNVPAFTLLTDPGYYALVANTVLGGSGWANAGSTAFDPAITGNIYLCYRGDNPAWGFDTATANMQFFGLDLGW